MDARIIILADIERDCDALFGFASKLAEHSSVAMVVLHQHIPVIPSMVSSSERTKLIKSSAAAARRKLEKLIKKFNFPANQLKISVTRNDLVDEIAEKYNPEDILLLSLNEKTGLFKKLFPVRTAIPVINQLNNSVICIPEGNTSVSLARCRVGVQKSNPIDVHELKRLLKLIHPEKGELRFFSVMNENEPQDEATAYLKELADYFDNDAQVRAGFDIVEGSDVFESIKNLMPENQGEFLILQKGSRLLTDKIFRKFLTSEIVNHAKIPLIVIS
jgi:nucleotide-binding universal stress UspA family protein